MAISFSDKLKIMKILSTEEGREKFKDTLVLKLKSQKAQEATASCIAESLGNMEKISFIEISSGEPAFLPLKVYVTADGEKRGVSGVASYCADSDYGALCEEFNSIVADNADEKAEFLKKTSKLLKEKIAEKGITDDEFSVKITE